MCPLELFQRVGHFLEFLVGGHHFRFFRDLCTEVRHAVLCGAQLLDDVVKSCFLHRLRRAVGTLQDVVHLVGGIVVCLHGVHEVAGDVVANALIAGEEVTIFALDLVRIRTHHLDEFKHLVSAVFIRRNAADGKILLCRLVHDILNPFHSRRVDVLYLLSVVLCSCLPFRSRERCVHHLEVQLVEFRSALRHGQPEGVLNLRHSVLCL